MYFNVSPRVTLSATVPSVQHELLSIIVIAAGDYSTNEARNKQKVLFLAVAFGFGKASFNPFHNLTAFDSTNSKAEKRTMEYRLTFKQEEREGGKKYNQKQLEEKEIERSTQLID
jgi:hypothetical protein